MTKRGGSADGRRKGAEGSQLKTLLARRDKLDEPALQRRRLEEQQLVRYATAQDKLGVVDDELGKRVAKLQEQIEAAHRDAEAKKAEWVVEQSEALAELSRLGRGAPELAEMFELPVKRVRKMIQAANTAEPVSRPGELPPDSSQSGAAVRHELDTVAAAEEPAAVSDEKAAGTSR